MHIPENYLSPSTCGVLAVAMVPVWAHAIKKVKKDVPKEKMPLLGVSAAFSFLAMMFNIPLPGGTTGHAVGGTLIAILLGPDAACLAVSITLLIQAMLFGDGGILSFGANCFNMAFVLPYVGYAIYKWLSGLIKSKKGKYIAAGIGSYIGINAAALCAAIEFGIQPILFTDAAGQAMYCPYGLNLSIPAMMVGHLTVFGLAEVVFTVALMVFLAKAAPDLIRDENGPSRKSMKPVIALIAVLVALVPIGLLAEGTAWGEWGIDEISSITTNGSALGYTPTGMSSGLSFSALMPDYSIGNLPDAIGYILSAIVGISICIVIFKLISASMKKKTNFDS